VGFDDASNAMIAIRRPPKDSSLALGLLGFVAVLWVSEAVPLFVTSLAIPVVLVFSGSVDATDATAPFFHPIIVLFFAGFLMAEAMARSRLDRRVAVTVTARAGTSPVMLFATLIGLTAAMSMFMSNTAAAAVMVPIAVAITAPLDSAGFRKMVVLGIAYAATIGGVGSAIGTPGNQLAIEFLGEFTGRIVTFNEWFLFGLPMVICFLPLAGAYLWVTGDGRIDPARFVRAREAASAEYAKLGRPTRDETTVTAVFALVMIGWITQSAHGVHPGIVALAGAIVLFALGELQPNDLGRISWASLLTFGGGLTLGSFLVASGTSDALATNLGFLADVPTALAVTLVAIITVVLTTFASNTASAAILIPLAIPLAGVLGIDPTGLVILVAIASSIDFAFVVGTPPTMIAYSTGLFTAGTIFRKGIVLDLVGVILLSLVVTQIWNLFGLV
jgi:sodium-dependent dicarboxylate transporter 2/3/5